MKPLSNYLNKSNLFIAILCFSVFVACKKEDEQLERLNQTQDVRTLILPEVPYDYAGIELPPHFQTTALSLYENFANPVDITNDGATLGRVLFYDTQLSENNTVSCASCHQQLHAFSDPGIRSVGFEGDLSNRHSQTLVNLRWARRMFWDHRVTGLENQVLIPIQDPIEMGMNLDALTARLQATPYYPDLFNAAFGSDTVSAERIANALSQFITSIYSYRSKYDEGLMNNFANFSEEELAGKDIFFNGETRCNQCHSTALFFDPQARNTGLDYTGDLGLYEVTGIESDKGKFKTTTLRNIELTAPYMHDGRFATLTEAIQHYNEGILPDPNLDDRLAVGFEPGGTPIEMNLSDEEVANLVSFLKTFTDEALIYDPMYADPFQP
jgi:cytochrome c peroxidase